MAVNRRENGKSGSSFMVEIPKVGKVIKVLHLKNKRDRSVSFLLFAKTKADGGAGVSEKCCRMFSEKRKGYSD
jgi:hypothetical protein